METFIKSAFLALSLLTVPAIGMAQDAKPAVVDQKTQTVNINSASAGELEKLVGIGPAKAKAIIEYREQNGAFTSVSDLEKVKGIGAKTMEKNAGKMSI